jgi:hypothetical protein
MNITQNVIIVVRQKEPIGEAENTKSIVLQIVKGLLVFCLGLAF